MDLYYRKSGNGAPFVILHGLYGSSDNWVSIGKKLSANFSVYLVDQRNHGRSPHSENHNYKLMVQDLVDFFDFHNIEKAILLGHSMGGKTASFFSGKYPERVSKLIVADISPVADIDDPYVVSHAFYHKHIIRTLMSIDLSSAKTLTDIDNLLGKKIKEERLRQFFLKSIGRDDGKYYWRINLKVLDKDLLGLFESPTEGDLEGIDFPVLFIRGENSNYITDKNFEENRIFFPKSSLVTIPSAGHWIHSEQPELFLDAIMKFVIDNE